MIPVEIEFPNTGVVLPLVVVPRPKYPMDLNVYTDPSTGVSVHIPDKVWIDRGGKIANRRKKIYSGPPRVMGTCPFCQREFSARDLRDHRGGCKKRVKAFRMADSVTPEKFHCQFCDRGFGAREIDPHIATCKKNPRNRLTA